MSTPFNTFDDIYQAARSEVGVRLFTVSAIADNGTAMARVYTTHPDVYPVGGKKTFSEDTDPQWLQHVIEDQQPFMGKDKEAVRAFFFDYETIESLGCGAIINVPVISDGKTVGSMNFLDTEGSYNQVSLQVAVQIAERSGNVLEETISTVG
ncbi:GAF domain-containing protein [Arthrobacter sp. VKM Ac-2550]|uniref:GAF domain-containing protein n=1 Tax=Crystallibacter permensis TaxID=1938888 RepID=UPI00222789E3|nr:GAF domain-containing protein [Arthrobacter sp. VKM Ac-2550]MCW2132356.1 hypothetical protein [Arthrobacter sp. VKM Ac-2550]